MIAYDRVTFTTNGSGAATVYSRAFRGYLHCIRYVYGDAATGADFTITDDATGLPILTITNAGTSSTNHYPRAACVGITNAALVYAATDPVTDRIPVTSQVKFVVAEGGAAKSGTFVVVWEE